MITSGDLYRYLETTVNLHREDVAEFRKQVNYLRSELDSRIRAYPSYALLTSRHFGSLAKGTAVAGLKEIDVAILLRPGSIPASERGALLGVIRELLLPIYPNKDPGDFVVDEPAVTVSFRTSGRKVDVVPVISASGEWSSGFLAHRGGWLETDVPRHLEIIRTWKVAHPTFIPLVRLTKWWRNERGVPLPSFVCELLWAHLMERGLVPRDDLVASLLGFFGYIERSGLKEMIVFPETSDPAVAMHGPVCVADPVNPRNNAAGSMTVAERDASVSAAGAALDALAQASTAHTPTLSVGAMRKVFGSSFNP
jgi:hypothetical protein